MPLTRRTLLGLGIGGVTTAGIAGLAGCSGDGPLPGPGPEPTCAPRGDMISRRKLGAAELIYDISGEAMPFRFEPGFYDQLQRWLADYLELSGTSRPDRISTFGSWLDGEPDCDSWHDAGRAFDLSRLSTGGEVQVSCRYDLWRSYRGNRLDRFRTRYWALAASLHLHFAYVLTYLYNETHHNHIHIDNGRSGSELSTFSTRSPAQVQAVQGMLNHVWNRQLEITGDWDEATDDAAAEILDQLEVGGRLDDGPQQWRTFLRSTTSKGC